MSSCAYAGEAHPCATCCVVHVASRPVGKVQVSVNSRTAGIPVIGMGDIFVVVLANEEGSSQQYQPPILHLLLISYLGDLYRSAQAPNLEEHRLGHQNLFLYRARTERVSQIES